MEKYSGGNTVKLTEDAQPVGTVGASHFLKHVKDGEYWGVPKEYFSVEDDKVYLDSRLAHRLRWKVDGVMPDMLNIAALRDEAEVDGNKVSVNPGFWCSNVPKDDVL